MPSSVSRLATYVAQFARQVADCERGLRVGGRASNASFSDSRTCRAVVGHFLDSVGSQARAGAQAREFLAAKIRNTVVAIPCPQCGFYQADIVRQLKENAWNNPMQIVGAIVVLVSFVPLAFDFGYAWIGDGDRGDGIRILAHVWPAIGSGFLVETALATNARQAWRKASEVGLSNSPMSRRHT